MTSTRRGTPVRLARVAGRSGMERYTAVRRSAARVRRRLLRRRAAPVTVSPFIDYGPDWPPVPQAPPRHLLLRRCVAVVIVYAIIWSLGAVLLEIRLHQLRDLPGHAPVTTYDQRPGNPARPAQ